MENKRKNLSLLIIGDEILSGQTKEKNIHTIALFCNEHGLDLKEVRIVGDEMEMIIHAVNELRHKYDYLFTTGGIGPTHDDITAMAIAKAFNLELKINQQAIEMIREISPNHEISEGQMRMAKIPQGAKLIKNFISGAPGFIVENIFVLAGVPKIMQAMIEEVAKIIPSGARLFSKTIYCGVGESKIAKNLAKIQSNFPDVKIGSYPKIGKSLIYSLLVLRSTNKESLEKAEKQVQKMINIVHKENNVDFAKIKMEVNNGDS